LAHHRYRELRELRRSDQRDDVKLKVLLVLLDCSSFQLGIGRGLDPQAAGLCDAAAVGGMDSALDVDRDRGA
jgi:hypothetical protein